ncbi:MAG: DUF3857 domain-containing protein [Lentimicrobiaceae bacterium]|nr:DUF3857 domain-containing protein [Lentimicrobiaceae bacterium]
MRKICGFSLFMLLAAWTFGQSLKYADFQWDSIPFSAYNLEQYGEENTVILASKHCIEYQYNQKTQHLEMFVTVHKKYLALTDKSLEDVNKISISLSEESSIVEMNARFITQDGKVTEVSKNRIKTIDKGENSNNKLFAIEGASVPGIVEYYYIIKQQATFSNVQSSYYCQWQVPAYNVSFELYCPKNLRFLFKTYNDTPPVEEPYADTTMRSITNYSKTHNDTLPVEESYVDSTVRYYRLFLDSVSAMPNERWALNYANFKRITYSLAYNYANKITRMQTLDEAAQFFYESYMELNKKETKLLTATLKKIALKNLNEEEKIRKIELWVKSNINNVNTSDPSAKNLEFILKNNIANGIGFARLLTGLYKTAELPFEFVLSCDKTDYRFDPDFNAWNYLDDILLYFPNLKKYIKPDEFGYRLGYIPVEFQNNYGLFLKIVRLGDAESFKQSVRLIEPVPLKNSMDTMYIKAAVSKDGNQINYQMNRLIYGAIAANYQAYYDLVNDEFKKEIQNTFVKVGDNAVVDECTVKNTAQADVLLKPFHFEATAHTDAVNMANDKYIVNIGELIGEQSELYNDKKRRQPVDVQSLHGYYRLIEFTIPEGYRCEDISSLNMDVILDDGAGISARFTSKAEIIGNLIKVDIVEFYEKMEYPVELYDAFKTVINAAADFNKASVVLVKI